MNYIREFLVNAVINAIAAKDATIYERAFNNIVGNLGSIDAVQRQLVPTPKMLARFMIASPLAFMLSGEDICTGLFIAELVLTPTNNVPVSAITWDYFNAAVKPIAMGQIAAGPLS